jgi:hydroxyethylthiazole kinase
MKDTIYSRVFADVRETRPLVHYITNYVTVNDVANITLCIGASPVMSHALEEVEEMVSHAGALVLNMGTLDPAQVEAMHLAGRAANSSGIPVIFDPVGAGATTYRTKTARDLMEELDIAILKGNQGEIGVLAGVDARVRGVDSGGISGDPVIITRKFAESEGITVVMSGETDIVSDGDRVLLVENGHPMMGCISGSGCMASSVTGACAAVCSDSVIAAASALSIFGVAGEKAARLSSGPGSFKPALFDNLTLLTPEEFAQRGRIRVR